MDIMMFVNILEVEYEDDELEMIVKKLVKLVYYYDEIFGKFIFEKSIKVFEKNILWVNEQCELYFDWYEDESIMKFVLKIVYIFFEEQDKWS